MYLKSSWRFLKDLFVLWRKQDVYRVSASLCLTTTLSLIPLFTVVLGFAEMMGGFDKAITRVEPFIFQYLAPGTAPDFVQNLQASIDRSRGRTIGLISILFLLWTVSRLLIEIDAAFRSVMGEENTRALGKGLALNWLVLLLGPVLLGSALFLPTFLGHPAVVLEYILIASGFLLVTVIFRFSLASHVSWRVILISSSSSVVGVMISERVYLWLAKALFSYNEIYGSLSFLPLFLVWMIVFWNIVLISMLIGRVVLDREIRAGANQNRPNLMIRNH
jgi:membrane protein